MPSWADLPSTLRVVRNLARLKTKRKLTRLRFELKTFSENLFYFLLERAVIRTGPSSLNKGVGIRQREERTRRCDNH